ncbi:MAG: hypothetical protein MJH09_00555 [Cetobacterium sp.]|nr:hypothetical protein [Cetobacterium sp.]
MNRELYQNNNENNDELDLMELLEILLREKKTIIITFIIVSLVALGGALFERNRSKEALGIININNSKIKSFNENNLLPLGVLEKIYRENNIEVKNNISLDEFKGKFKIKGIVPKEIEEKKEKYTPNNYIISLRVGSPLESKNLLKDYYSNLRNFYREKYESGYKFEKIPVDILMNKNYDYGNYLEIVERNKNNLKNTLIDKVNENLNYPAYGFGYREVEIAIKNLENIRIMELRNYLDSTDIVRDIENFKSQYKSKRDRLINDIESKEKESIHYKKLLENSNFSKENIILPKGVKINEDKDDKDIYYVELMEKYLNVQLEIENLKEKLNILEKKNTNVREGNKEEQEFILNRLRKVIERYNKIVEKVNILESRENDIENGSLVKLGSPVVIVSDSKAKLILGGGIILGIFLGIAIGFIKNFIGEFKKGRHQLLSILILCCLVGYKGYGQEILKVTYTQKGLEKGVNPDGSFFQGEKSIKDIFLKEAVKLDNRDLQNIEISPIIPNGIYKEVENKIQKGENYVYIPSEYKIVLNLSNKDLENKVKEELTNNYPKFYIDYYLDRDDFNSKINYMETYDTYRESLEAFKNLIGGLDREINNRINNSLDKESKYEYEGIKIKLQRVREIQYERILNYLNSKNIVLNINLEKILLKGKIDILKRKIENYREVEKIYRDILNKYTLPNNSVVLLENGEISVNGGSSLREKEYINISKKYLKILGEENNLQKELKENQELYNFMREGSKKEKDKIKSMFITLQNTMNEIINSMKNIELKDYNKEYSGRVKITPEKN